MSIQSTKIQSPTFAATSRAWRHWAGQLCSGQNLMNVQRHIASCPSWRLARLYSLLAMQENAYVMLHIHRNPTWNPRKEAYDA